MAVKADVTVGHGENWEYPAGSGGPAGMFQKEPIPPSIQEILKGTGTGLFFF